jgi:hypothetical protein
MKPNRLNCIMSYVDAVTVEKVIASADVVATYSSRVEPEVFCKRDGCVCRFGKSCGYLAVPESLRTK